MTDTDFLRGLLSPRAWTMRLSLLCGLLLTSGANAQFSQVADIDNPFLGIADNRPAPALADMDADGDLDLVLGTAGGAIRYFANVGTAFAGTYAERVGTANPFFNLNIAIAAAGFSNTVPTLLDLNGDLRADLVLGFNTGEVVLAMQAASPPHFSGFVPLTAVYGALPQNMDIGQDAAPLLVDIDVDGDIDIVLGGAKVDDDELFANVNINYNQGAYIADTAPSFIGKLYDVEDNEQWARPAAADLDSDGDFDLVFGIHDEEGRHKLYYYENQPVLGVPVFNRSKAVPLKAFDGEVSAFPAPAFADIDSDGDMDIVVGDENNSLILIRNGPAPSLSALGIFGAVDVGAMPADGITTRIAGANSALDIIALLPDFSDVNPAFLGAVSLRLLNAIDDSGPVTAGGCRTSWFAVDVIGSATFSLADNGRVTVPLPAYPDALRKARIEITDSASGSVFCSHDDFSIRPDRFQVIASDDDINTPGTSRLLNNADPASGPVHTAARGFTVRVTALNAQGAVTPGWDGAPQLAVASAVLGSTTGALSVAPGVTTAGEWRSDGVSYGEVGAFELQVQDNTFSSTDAGELAESARTVGPALLDVGRFVPADFAFSSNVPVLRANCGNYSYLGEPVGYQDLPEAILVAVNANGVTTKNYTGPLMRIADSSLSNYRYESNAGIVDAGSALVPPMITDNGDGSVDLLLESGAGVSIALPRATPVPPLAAEIALKATISDLDGVTASSELAFGDTVASGIDFDPLAGNNFRFGRMSLMNEYAAEMHPIDMPVMIDYFADLGGGATGFVANTDDCLVSGDFSVADINLDESALGDGSIGQTTVASFVLGGGLGNIRLNPPGAAGNVVVTHDISVSFPWLRPDADNDGSFDNAPSAVATFGIKADERNRVYQRERTQ